MAHEAGPGGPGGGPPPSPERFFETAHGIYRSYAMKAALELDLFTAIAGGASDVDAIAGRCGASRRGTRILCDYFTIIGFLTKQDGRYACAPDAALFLNRQSPAWLGSAIEFLLAPHHIDAISRLPETVRTGHADTSTLEPDHPIWVTFARAMAPMLAMPARMMAEAIGVAGAGPMTVLDIAAGHGLWGISVAQLNPQAEIVGADWGPVLEVAKENAAKAGVAGRYRTITGSAFTADLGTGYDLVLVPNFLHHFDEPTCTQFLQRVRGTLKDGGRVVVCEFVPNDDRVTPPMAAAFSMTMLINTPAGDAYTFAQLQTMLTDAGFRDINLQRLPVPTSTVITARR
ncbi:MAG TPA: class I SAM-dependent methyltransferase [Vicinamibacterales bacterium]|nr:class I SAM-dependent methyltransferase [Vicinamibacterales bacterium]